MNHPPTHHHHQQQGASGLPPPGRFPEPGGPPPPFTNGPTPHQPILGGPPGVGGALFGAPPPPPPPGYMPPPNMMLPPGWTEHKAPDGMAYFYNAATGSSSWVRPTMQPSMAPPPGMLGMGIPSPPGMSRYPPTQQPLYPPGVAPPPGLAPPGIAPAPIASIDDAGKGKKGKRNKKEKAVKKTRILDSPWFIVETNMDNTFFYNKETKVSIWIPTPELEIVLIKMGQVATEKAEAERRARDAEEQERLQALKRPFEMDAGRQGDGDKRFRNDTGQEAQGTEMTEDDVAWQLAAMEEMMGEQDQDQHMASQDEYDDDDEDEEDDNAMQERLRMLQGSSAARAAANLEIIPENIQDREMAFLDMMRERGVTQFDTVDMALGKVERDPRYRLIPDKKDKIALFDSYCVIRAREVKDAREKEEQKEEKEEEEGDRRTKDKHTSSSRDSKSHTTSSSTSASKTSNKPEDVYRRLVEEYTTKTSTWLSFMTKYRVDPRFVGLKPGSLRESVFRQYLSDLKKGIIQPPSKSRESSSSSDKDKRSSSSQSHSRSSSTKSKATDAEIDEFMSLLKETKKDILYEHKNSSSVEWRKIKKLIDRDRRYDAVGSSTERELLFRKYADRVIQRRD